MTVVAGLNLTVVSALLSALLGAGAAWQYQANRYEARELAEQVQRQELALAAQAEAGKLRLEAEAQAAQHAQTLSKLNTQLVDANVKIASLSNRRCLSSDTVSMLNKLGAPSGPPVREAPSEPADSAPAASSDSNDGPEVAYASERDVAQWMATCKVRYGEVSDQLNRLIDIVGK